jgi:hypothetical protein
MFWTCWEQVAFVEKEQQVERAIDRFFMESLCQVQIQ